MKALVIFSMVLLIFLEYFDNKSTFFMAWSIRRTINIDIIEIYMNRVL